MATTSSYLAAHFNSDFIVMFGFLAPFYLLKVKFLLIIHHSEFFLDCPSWWFIVKGVVSNLYIMLAYLLESTFGHFGC